MPPWSTQPNDVIDTLAFDYIYDTDPPRIQLKTSSLAFVDIPEGEETVRGVTFRVVTCQILTFNITAVAGVLAGLGLPVPALALGVRSLSGYAAARLVQPVSRFSSPARPSPPTPVSWPSPNSTRRSTIP